ncbi:MAG: FKBP-type peptidyl-prolyl cis-trans isomerase, partial [Candidatus Altiarchaeota archaeon]|nr:FKBP-type peptidyl-prolyl cis-trans isomerase [Candidatus Altiarchaeota archaeon]
MKKGDFVKISFTGSVDGRVIDTTDESIAKKEGIFNKDRVYKPIPIIVGEGMILKGVDNAAEELEVDKEKTIKIPPKDGFGERNAAFVRLVPMRE